MSTSVSVQYQKKCGSGKKFLVTYTNQIVINSSTFSAGGDSGSLIVSNTNPSCRQPVALLYAGSSTTTIGNPIGEVLTKLGSELGTTFSFVGQNCTAAATARATARPGVIAVGVGASASDPSEPAIMIYVDKPRRMRAHLAGSIDGVEVRVFDTDPIIAF